MQRLAALVPRPRLHLIRFHGVLAPNARLEPMVALGDQRTAASEKCDRLLRVGSARSRNLKAAARRAILIGGCKAAYNGPSWRKAVPTAMAELQELAMFLRASALWFAADVHFD